MARPAALISAIVTLLVAATAWSEASRRVSGEPMVHVVEPGESLWSVGARHGASVRALARDNGLDTQAWLQIGQLLSIDPRHVVPGGVENGLLLNVPQRMLFHFAGGELLEAFPIAVGRPSWPTPVGEFHVVEREIDKTWRIPLSIQREACRLESELCRPGEPPVTEVPPGPGNPLGRHWIGLSRRGYGIHGTIAPSSIFHFVTHGCIRMHPDDVAALYPSVQLGDEVRIVYDPILLAELPDGRIYLEAHPDAYRRAGDPLESARELADRSGLKNRIDWRLAEDVLEARDGVARDVSRQPAANETEGRPE